MIRVYAVPEPQAFRLILAAFLLPLGLGLCTHTARRHSPSQVGTPEPERAGISGLALIVGVVGGI